MNKISFREALRYWLKLGFISFGGPAGQIAMMHKEIVENKKWVEEKHFLQALNFCMLLPGPEAQQLATYMGWVLHRIKGGIAAGLFFIIPAVFIMWGLSWLYASMGSIPSVAALFYGLKPAVVAIVAEAVLRMGKKSLKGKGFIAIAALSFVGIYFLNIPFPVIVFSAGIIGYVSGHMSLKNTIPESANISAGQKDNSSSDSYFSDSSEQPSTKGIAKTALVCFIIWLLPLLIILLWKGANSIFMDIGILFSKAAIVTFGGAYAVLSFISQQAVERYNWLTSAQMMDGLGLAGTIPGPLIMINQFVGYLAAYQNPEGLNPIVAGTIGGLLATWMTFAPSFLFIFAGAPYVERIRGNLKLSFALAAITAAVVGVILNLGIIFARHTLLPETGVFDWFALAILLTAFSGMQFFKWPMIPVIIGAAAAGYIWKIVI